MTVVVGAMLAATVASAETKRVAIVVGNNAGGPGMAPLRFAESDAGKMARVLVELGDVNPDDILLLQGRKSADVERAIADARERIAMFKRSPDVRTVLIFFFSGHSDGEAMELGVDGVLMNTAIAEAKDPIRMARAMKLAVQAGRDAYLSGRMATRKYADPSSPLAGMI